MRVRNQRTGKWLELPDDDGLVYAKVRLQDGRDEWQLCSADHIHRAYERKLAAFDRLSIQHRWEIAYFSIGNGDKTTPTFEAFAAAGIEDLL